MPHSGKLLVLLTVASTACSAPDAITFSSRPTDRPRSVSIAIGTTQGFDFPEDTIQRVWAWMPVGLLSWPTPTAHSLDVTCHQVGSTVLNVEVTRPDATSGTYRIPIECHDQGGG